MRVVTDQRASSEAHQPAAPQGPRLGGTDIFRGALVIVAALVIGGFLIGQGLGDSVDGTAATEDEALPAADEAPTTDTSLTDTGATGDETAPATGDAVAGQATATPSTDVAATDDPAAPATTDTVPDPLATLRPPSEVRVLVLNGAGTQGIAARGTEMLQAQSYITAAPKNADVLGPSVIYYIDGYVAEAQAVAAVYGPALDGLVTPLDPLAPPVEDLQDAAVVVVLGNDSAIPVP